MKLAADESRATSMVGISLMEHPLPIIELLLQEFADASCVCDTNGLTPLLKAASFKKPCISAIKTMLNSYPQCAKVCDGSRKSILHVINEMPNWTHYKSLRRIPEVYALKNHQDSQGNTPAHIAVKNRHVFMLKLLLRMSANFAIKNKEVVSAEYLIHQQLHEFQNLLDSKKVAQFQHGIAWAGSPRRFLNDELAAQRYYGSVRSRGRLDKITCLVEKADARIPEQDERIKFQHWMLIACYFNDPNDQYVKEALKHYFAIYGATAFSSCPLHTMVRCIPEAIDSAVLRLFQDCFFQARKEYVSSENLSYPPPWMMKNADGDTPLHQALQLLQKTAVDSQRPFMRRCIIEFLKFDITICACQNNNKETPLHLLSQVTLNQEEIKAIMEVREQVTVPFPENGFPWHDKDGLTPVLRAAENNNFHAVKLLRVLAGPFCLAIRGKDGRTLWHLVAEKPPADFGDPNPDIDDLLNSIYSNGASDQVSVPILYSTDNDGNTPLHKAIRKQNFEFAQRLIDCMLRVKKNEVKFLSIRNKMGVSPVDMIGSATHLPSQFQSFLWNKRELAKQMLGVRSIRGVPATMVKDYVNTIGVIAALLATITFTAAFAVPGGLDPSNGTPILMRRAAYQVFLVSDILALCLSMMILFCLLWIMGSDTERVVLLDLVIFLLELSFYATLVAFMTGLYVTTFHIEPWIAILACVLCSLLILLMREAVIIFIIRPVMKLLILYRRAPSLIKEFLYMLLCGIPKDSMISSSQQPIQNNREALDGTTGHGEVQLEQGGPDQQQHAETADSVTVMSINDTATQGTGSPRSQNEQPERNENAMVLPDTGTTGQSSVLAEETVSA